MIQILLFFLSSCGVCLLVARLIHSDNHLIRDLIHIYLPYIRFKYVSDILIFCQLAYLSTIITRPELTSFLLIIGCVQYVKCLTMTSTILPRLNKYDDKV